MLFGFLLLQFACQTALIAPLGSMRILFRATTFLSSLAMLLFVPAGGLRYPAHAQVVAVILLTGIGLLHPDLNSPISGIAQVALTVAIWSPVFWVTRIKLRLADFRTLVLLLWGFNVLSAIVGVLQVYDPSRFSPDPEFIKNLYGEMSEGLKVTLDNGEKVWRPMGLTDSPGGAASSGMFAVLAGLIFVVGEKSKWFRCAGAAGALAGMFCIYLCQVRSTLILTGIGVVVLLIVKIMRGRADQAVSVAVFAGIAVVGGFLWATSVGSVAVTSRLETLIEDRADKVYYANRGFFLEHTIDQIGDYPLGAGGGRWGMMFSYFGDRANASAFPLHAEIQPTAWLYDGGLMLILVGYSALLIGISVTIRIAFRTPDPWLAEIAALIIALDLGVLSHTLSYPVFVSQGGMMCWFLNAALFTTANYRKPQRAKLV